MPHLGIRLSFAVVLALTACAASPDNQPLAPNAANVERRSILPDEPEAPLILMSFSGGGSRAAALAASVLEELHDTQYELDGNVRNMADDVKLISSVSGGSVTSAWFGLTGVDGLETLRRDFLVQDNMAALELTGANPFTWFRLIFTDFTRVHALIELLDSRLYDHKTFKDLNRPGRPFVVLNASDMSSGHVFAFTPRRFDDICSDLDSLPISVGVAASAAFPILLTPVNFHNYSTDCRGAPRKAGWIEKNLTSSVSPYLDLRTYREARYANDLRRDPPQFRDIRELHFLDGGLADNLGIDSLISALTETYDDTHLLREIGDGHVRKLVVIVVNARSDAANDLDQEAGRPGLMSQLSAVTSVPIDAASAGMEGQLSDLLVEFRKAAKAAPAAEANFAGMKVYAVFVDFDQLPATTDDERALRNRVKEIPTLWSIKSEQLRDIDKVGPLLLNRDPCFRLLIKDLGGMPKGESQVPDSACHKRVGETQN